MDRFQNVNVQEYQCKGTSCVAAATQCRKTRPHPMNGYCFPFKAVKAITQLWVPDYCSTTTLSLFTTVHVFRTKENSVGLRKQ